MVWSEMSVGITGTWATFEINSWNPMDENKVRLISETESALSHSDFNWNEQTLFMGTWLTQIQMNETSEKF